MTSPRLANRTEEIVTHALGFILNSSEASRKALQDFLLAHGSDIGRISEVKTQFLRRSGYGEPDMAGYDPDNNERLLVEAKFGADLTPSQPVTYLKRLRNFNPEGKPTALLFVAPSERLESLWVELRQRVSDAEGLDLSNEQTEQEIRWGDVGENRKLILTSWRFLVDTVAAYAASAVAQTVNDLHQIQGMVELRSFDPLRQGPLPPEFPRSLPHLYALVDDAVDGLAKANLAVMPPRAYRPAAERDYGVRYFTFCKLVNCSLGIYFGDWRTYHHSPLRFTLHNDSVNDSIVQALRKEPYHAYDLGGSHIYIPIHLQGRDYQAVLNSIVEQIKRIAAVIEPNPD